MRMIPSVVNVENLWTRSNVEGMGGEGGVAVTVVAGRRRRRRRPRRQSQSQGTSVSPSQLPFSNLAPSDNGPGLAERMRSMSEDGAEQQGWARTKAEAEAETETPHTSKTRATMFWSSFYLQGQNRRRCCHSRCRRKERGRFGASLTTSLSSLSSSSSSVSLSLSLPVAIAVQRLFILLVICVPLVAVIIALDGGNGDGGSSSSSSSSSGGVWGGGNGAPGSPGGGDNNGGGDGTFASAVSHVVASSGRLNPVILVVDAASSTSSLYSSWAFINTRSNRHCRCCSDQSLSPNNIRFKPNRNLGGAIGIGYNIDQNRGEYGPCWNSRLGLNIGLNLRAASDLDLLVNPLRRKKDGNVKSVGMLGMVAQLPASEESASSSSSGVGASTSDSAEGYDAHKDGDEATTRRKKGTTKTATAAKTTKSPTMLRTTDQNEKTMKRIMTIKKKRGNNSSNNNNNNKNQLSASKIKNQVRSLFRKARDLERQGRWREASDVLRRIVYDIDPTDSHSHLALARLEARREGLSSASLSSSSSSSSLHATMSKHGSSRKNVKKEETTIQEKGQVVEEEEGPARAAFRRGTVLCPDSVHLWQAWAMHERSRGHGTTEGLFKARELFEKALHLDRTNPYVCHAYGLMELTDGKNPDRARELWERALGEKREGGGGGVVADTKDGTMGKRSGNAAADDDDDGNDEYRSTAALVCSLGELHVSSGRYESARDLYARHVHRIKSARERTEVYLASAWLEERHFRNVDRAAELLDEALRLSPGDSRALIASARLEGRRAAAAAATASASAFASSSFAVASATGYAGRGAARGKGGSVSTSVRLGKDRIDEVRRRLVQACSESRIRRRGERNGGAVGSRASSSSSRSSSPNNGKGDGRLFNAWAKLEVRSGRLGAARKVLQKGMRLFPRDHSLLQAAGKVEERIGNYTGARELYSRSLTVEPSAPTLVAYALLELSHPEGCSPKEGEGFVGRRGDDNDDDDDERNRCQPDTRKALSLFEEALLLDPRHGPAYNAYGNSLLRLGRVDEARDVFERGVSADCRDPASVHHGLARLELSLGNVERARDALNEGLDKVRRLEAVMDNRKRGRAAFLAHTLGMLELNSHRVQVAKEVFDSGLERYGDDSSQLLLGAALCEVRLGNDDAARRLFADAVRADRRHAQAWQAWGVMEMRAGDYKTAKTLFECGIKSRPDHGALWQAYGTMESRWGNIDVARALFAAGIEKCPEHVPLYQAWACLELRGRNFDRARVLIGEALTRDKEQGSGWLVAAKIEEQQGNDGMAMLILRRGIECDPNNAELYRALSELEIKRGRIDDARRLLEKGLDIDPLHAPSYHTLAELEARVFNVEGLAKLNKRAAEVFNANALASPASTAAEDAWGKKIRSSRPNVRLPDGVAALAEEIGGELDLDLGQSLIGADPDSVIEGLNRFEDDDIFPASDGKQ